MESKISSLQQEIANMEENRKLTYQRITKVDAKKFRIINENFIFIKCENIEDVKKVILNLLPAKNGWEIGHTKCGYITSLYRVDMKNDVYGNSELKIWFENLTGLDYNIHIDVDNLPNTFCERYFYTAHRNPVDSERHYTQFQGLGYKKFKEPRIAIKGFRSSQVGWYGGDLTLVCEETIKEMIEDIKRS